MLLAASRHSNEQNFAPQPGQLGSAGENAHTRRQCSHVGTVVLVGMPQIHLSVRITSPASILVVATKPRPLELETVRIFLVLVAKVQEELPAGEIVRRRSPLAAVDISRRNERAVK